MATEPVVILDRNQVAHMNAMYKRTRPAPWKKPVLIEMGVREEDVDFIIMVHARFPDLVNTILHGITQQEILLSKLGEAEDALNVGCDHDKEVVPIGKKRGRPKTFKDV